MTSLRMGQSSAVTHRRVDVLIGLALVAMCASTGVVLAIDPILGFVPVAALVCGLLLVDTRARIVLLVFGGLFLFQRGEGLNMAKLAFLVMFGVAFAGAFLNVRGLWSTSSYRVSRPLFAASMAFVALAAGSLLVADANAIPLMGGWLRDIAPYLLFACAPVFALDAQFSLSRKWLVRTLLAAGTVATLAFAIEWFHRRGIADFQASRIGLASPLLPTALFAYGMAMVLHVGRMRWLAVSGLVLALLLVTGTRSNLALLIAPLAIAVGTRHQRTTRSIRLALVAPLALAIVVVAALSVISTSSFEVNVLNERIQTLMSTGASDDASYVERIRQARAAWNVFDSNPIVGAGPGTVFEWVTYDRKPASSFVIDTPLTFPAKFGVIGLVVALFVVVKYWSFMRSLARRDDPGVGYLALLGYLTVALALTFFATPFEDKGFSLGLILLLAIALKDYARDKSVEEMSSSAHAQEGLAGRRFLEGGEHD